MTTKQDLEAIARELDSYEQNPESQIEILTEDEMNEFIHRTAGGAATEKASIIRLEFGKWCGFGNSGNIMYAVNTHRSRSVKVTFTVTSVIGTTETKSERVDTIPPSGRLRLGCSRGEGTGYASFSWLAKRQELV